MGQYNFPRTERLRILATVNPSGTLDIRSMDSTPVVSPSARWWRYVCDNEKSRAVLVLSEHEQLPNDVVVTVSTDLRRLPFFWTLLRDWRLSRLLSKRLLNAGGQLIDA